jgi:hypothetical protein
MWPYSEPASPLTGTEGLVGHVLHDRIRSVPLIGHPNDPPRNPKYSDVNDTARGLRTRSGSVSATFNSKYMMGQSGSVTPDPLEMFPA